MEKSQFTKIQLAKGEMAVYDFGTVKLHAYKTNDLIADECFLVEKAGRAFMIESPCFFDNLAEVEKYILENGWAFEGTVIAYHDPTEKHTIFQQKIKKKTNLLCKNP